MHSVVHMCFICCELLSFKTSEEQSKGIGGQDSGVAGSLHVLQRNAASSHSQKHDLLKMDWRRVHDGPHPYPVTAGDRHHPPTPTLPHHGGMRRLSDCRKHISHSFTLDTMLH